MKQMIESSGGKLLDEQECFSF